jgi:aspartate-semialdehyde dehydrogenase
MPLSTAKINVAILGATGAVGQRFIQLLANHPYFQVAEIAASDRNVGKRYADATHWVLPGAPPTDVANMTLLGLDATFKSPVIMSALPGDVAKTLEPTLAAAGHLVSSNTSANRMVEDVPLLLPEINADHIGLVEVQRRTRGWKGGLLTMTNCTTVPVAVALAPLLPFGITGLHVVSMQAVSGSGYPGVASLDIFDNVLPYIGGEEEKIETEPGKIFGHFDGQRLEHLAIRTSASCNRVAVLDSHMVCVSVAFAQKPSREDILEAWRNWQGHPLAAALPSFPKPLIAYTDLQDRPQPRLDRDAGHGMTTTIGRLRPCGLLDFKFVALSHNTVRGAAGGAILNAELAVAQGYVAKVPENAFAI